MFWALGEVLREECGIVDADSADEAWSKLRDYALDKLEHSGGKAATAAAHGTRPLELLSLRHDLKDGAMTITGRG